jgi:hypothetical protein
VILAVAAIAALSATLEVVPREATVGDRLTATLVVVLPPGARPDPSPLPPRLGQATVLGGRWGEPRPGPDGVRWTWTGELAAFAPGDLVLPAVTVAGAATDPVTVTIRSVLPPQDQGEAATLADLKPPAEIPPDYGPLRRALLVLAGLLALAGVATWLHRRWAGKLAAVPVPSDPFRRMAPEIWAYGALGELVAKGLPEEGRVDLFFAELSRILKQYLGGRYRLDLLERTTAEVPGLLRQAGAPPGAVADLVGLLQACDQVKFAQARPAAEACREAVESAYRLVDATRPVPAGSEAA